MIIDGISFNQQWAWGKTEAEFVNEFRGMDHIFPDAKDKATKLKEAYALLRQGKPVDAPVAKAATPPTTEPVE